MGDSIKIKKINNVLSFVFPNLQPNSAAHPRLVVTIHSENINLVCDALYDYNLSPNYSLNWNFSRTGRAKVLVAMYQLLLKDNSNGRCIDE